MNIPRQFYGVNYLSRIIDNFKDFDKFECPQTTYHSIAKGKDISLTKVKPYDVSMNTQCVSDYFYELITDREAKIDGVGIAYGENELMNEYRAPYSDAIPHITNSTCKTIVAIGIMFAIAEKRIHEDDLVLSFFSEYDTILTSKNVRQMTIYHLLTMTSCSKCNETSSLTEKNWIKAFLLSDCYETPGTKFIYNSMNTYMLSAILVKVTGETLVDYLNKRLFNPLGILNVKWELCPLGIEKGGWGLHLSLNGMLKIGMLLAHDGAFHGKQLIQPQYIRRMKEHHVSQNVDSLATGYGFQLWHLPNGCYMLSGMYGQHVLIDEKHNIVIATNAHNNKLFPDSVITKKTLDFFQNPCLFNQQNRLQDTKSYTTFSKRIKMFRLGNPNNATREHGFTIKPFFITNNLSKSQNNQLFQLLQKFDGKRLHVDHGTFKLFPYMLQGMYQYPPFHVTDISFHLTNNHWKLCFFKEKNKKRNNEDRERIIIQAGINEYFYQTIQFGEDERCIACRVYDAKDEDYHDVIMLEIVFPDAGFSRIIKLFLLSDRIGIECLEFPNIRDIINQILDGETTLAGNRIDISDKLPQSVHLFLEQKVEPHLNGYLRN